MSVSLVTFVIDGRTFRAPDATRAAARLIEARGWYELAADHAEGGDATRASSCRDIGRREIAAALDAGAVEVLALLGGGPPSAPAASSPRADPNERLTLGDVAARYGVSVHDAAVAYPYAPGVGEVPITIAPRKRR